MHFANSMLDNRVDVDDRVCDRLYDHARRLDPVAAQACKEGRTLFLPQGVCLGEAPARAVLWESGQIWYHLYLKRIEGSKMICRRARVQGR